MQITEGLRVKRICGDLDKVGEIVTVKYIDATGNCHFVGRCDYCTGNIKEVNPTPNPSIGDNYDYIIEVDVDPSITNVIKLVDEQLPVNQVFHQKRGHGDSIKCTVAGFIDDQIIYKWIRTIEDEKHWEYKIEPKYVIGWKLESGLMYITPDD